MINETIETDVLCVGGGIAGLMAAISASKQGARVIVAEKGNTLSSGAGGQGNDHFECYIPEVHGPDKEAFIRELLLGQKGEMLHDMHQIRLHHEKAFDIVKLWDSWGIPMRYQGKWEFSSHAFPGHTCTRLRYSGKMQKKILTHQALESGAQIMNRVMIFDLLQQQGKIIGAIGISTREDKVIVFKAKSVILGTGRCSRLYPAPVPNMLFNLAVARPTCTGDGRAMAYRAGAELCNIEITRRHIGPKYFSKAGQATWIGVLRDGDGNPVGTFVNKPDRQYGDIMAEVNKQVPENYAKTGKGPVYMDCTGISEEDYRYMMHWMDNEGNASLLKHFEDEGIDFRRNPIEFMTYEMRLEGHIVANSKTETAIKGLYAAGDETMGGISPAAVFGWISGEIAAGYCRNMEAPEIENARPKIETLELLIERIRSRRDGPDWQEVNIALQQTMNDYAGAVRYKNSLVQGLNHLRRLKQDAHNSLIANNPHELGRCLEVLNLLDLGELIMIAAEDRKESRGQIQRPDYPFTNPLLNSFHIIKQAKGDTATEWRGSLA